MMAVFQPSLFPDFKPVQPVAVVNAKSKAKELLNQLYQLRQNNQESPFLPGIANLISRVRSFGDATDNQVEETIMYAIEVQMCWTIADLVDEIRLDKNTIEDMLDRLRRRNLIRDVPRYIPGSGRQFYLIKSNRQDVGEMAEV